MIKEKINDEQIKGSLYIPEILQSVNPGVVLISGSDGGTPGANAIPEFYIEALVNEGYVVLALAYFASEDLPEHLEGIPLEYFENALDWFKIKSGVSIGSVALIGNSRGGEVALLLGSLFSSKIQAIVAYTPSAYVFGGFPFPNKPAWLYKGKVIPFLGGFSSQSTDLTEYEDLSNTLSQDGNEIDPFQLVDLFVKRNQLIKSNQEAKIKVENIECPLLIFSGSEDAIWPANFYCTNIIQRLVQHNVKTIYQHVNYPKVGHGIFASRDGAIYHPVGKFWCRLGGESEANQNAAKDSFILLTKFLNDHLN